MDVNAVLFDMDGTLVDSDAAVERAWSTWAQHHRVDRAAVFAIMHGAPPARTVRTLRPDLDDAAVACAAAWQLELQYDDLVGVGALPGAHALLADLDRRGVPWAVVTSADDRLASARLRAAGIAAPVLVTTDDVAAGKPDPEGYLLGAARLGVEARTCLVVEDSPVGAAAGHAAGAHVAGVRGIDADVRLADLDALHALLTSTGSSTSSPTSSISEVRP